MSGYTKFSDRFRKIEPSRLPPAKPAKPAKATPISYGDVQKPDNTLAALAALAEVPGQTRVFPEPAVIAPAEFSGAAKLAQPQDEPPFDQPCPSRRGLIDRRASLFLHFCVVCGRWGAFGYGPPDLPVKTAEKWYCDEHRPD